MTPRPDNGTDRVRSGTPFEHLAGYSRAVRRGPLVVVSGTAALDAAGRALHPGDSYAQTQEGITRALEACAQLGAEPGDVIRTRLFLAPQADWRAAVTAHGDAFRGIDPANTTVTVHSLIPQDCLVEVELEAVITESSGQSETP